MTFNLKNSGTLIISAFKKIFVSSNIIYLLRKKNYRKKNSILYQPNTIQASEYQQWFCAPWLENHSFSSSCSISFGVVGLKNSEDEVKKMNSTLI